MTATVYYDNVNEIALLSNTFLNSAGVPGDPTTTACIITDPSGAEVVHTFAGTAPAERRQGDDRQVHAERRVLAVRAGSGRAVGV